MVRSVSPAIELIPFAAMAASTRNDRTRRLWMERILDQKRNPLSDGGSNRGGVKHLRAEIRQFHRFFVCDLRQNKRSCDRLRIGAQDAVDIRLNLDHSGAKNGA